MIRRQAPRSAHHSPLLRRRRRSPCKQIVSAIQGNKASADLAQQIRPALNLQVDDFVVGRPLGVGSGQLRRGLDVALQPVVELDRALVLIMDAWHTAEEERREAHRTHLHELFVAHDTGGVGRLTYEEFLDLIDDAYADVASAAACAWR